MPWAMELQGQGQGQACPAPGVMADENGRREVHREDDMEAGGPDRFR